MEISNYHTGTDSSRFQPESAANYHQGAGIGAKLGIIHVVEYSGSMYAVDMVMSEKYKLEKEPAMRVGG
ncbi:MAG: hypothetical protein ABW148_14605 [Sedimenticola sp.]